MPLPSRTRTRLNLNPRPPPHPTQSHPTPTGAPGVSRSSSPTTLTRSACPPAAAPCTPCSRWGGRRGGVKGAGAPLPRRQKSALHRRAVAARPPPEPPAQPAQPRARAHRPVRTHPRTPPPPHPPQVRTQYRKIFVAMGFEEMPTNNYVESSFWNFDALFQPQQVQRMGAGAQAWARPWPVALQALALPGTPCMAHVCAGLVPVSPCPCTLAPPRVAPTRPPTHPAPHPNRRPPPSTPPLPPPSPQHPARDAHDTFFLTCPATSDSFPEDYLSRVKVRRGGGGRGDGRGGSCWSCKLYLCMARWRRRPR
jgi:hypothetical protein